MQNNLSVINFELIEFKRAIMHEIYRKTHQSDAMAICEDKLVELSSDVIKTLKERLNIALGKRTRCFQMNISNTKEDSFYSLCKDLKLKDNDCFITRSKQLANLLAESQNKSSIPGGYFLFIEGLNRANQTSVYIAIKADWQEALSKDKITGAISVLREVFLSPAQKFYKVGLIAEKADANQSIDPNDNFTCFLFDEQFNVADSIPAAYFFKEFLGFSEDKNSKIITKRFYDQTSSFINSNIPNFEERINLLNALKVNLMTSISPSFDPTEFGKSYIGDLQIRNSYSSQVLKEFPSSFLKDVSLLESTFKRSSMFFPNKIKLVGPSSDFDTNVTVISNKEELEQMGDSISEYTILLVKGKPQKNV